MAEDILVAAKGLNSGIKALLIDSGITSVKAFLAAPVADLIAIEGIGPAAMMAIMIEREKLNVPDAPNADTTAADLIEAVGGEPDPPAAKGKKYMTQEPPEDERTVTTVEFTIALQFRHADWVIRAAEVYEMTPLQVIEQAVRQAYQRDPYKAGDTASSGSILAHDMHVKP